MSELVEAIPQKNGQLKLSGTYAQAWSVAEYVRNGYQDFAGFKPNLLKDEVLLMPSVPSKWNSYSSEFAFGQGARFTVDFKRDKTLMNFTISYKGYAKPLTVNLTPLMGTSRVLIQLKLKAGQTAKVEFDSATGKAKLNGKEVKTSVYLPSYDKIIGDLKFVKPDMSDTAPSLKQKDYLQKIIESKQYK